MKILLYLCTFVFGLFGVLVSADAVEQALTGGSTPMASIVLGIIFLLISLACWHRARKNDEGEETISTGSTPSAPVVDEPINYYPDSTGGSAKQPVQNRKSALPPQG